MTNNTTNNKSNLTDYQVSLLAEVISNLSAEELRGLNDVINDVAKKLEKEGSKLSKKEQRAEKKAARKAKREAKKAARLAKKEGKKVSAEDLNTAEEFFSKHNQIFKNVEEFLNDCDDESYEDFFKSTGLEEDVVEEVFEILSLS